MIRPALRVPPVEAYLPYDDSPLCNEEDKRKYWQMIGELQWAVSLGRIDIMNAVISLGTFRPAPRVVGHLELAKRVSTPRSSFGSPHGNGRVERLPARCGSGTHPALPAWQVVRCGY